MKNKSRVFAFLAPALTFCLANLPVSNSVQAQESNPDASAAQSQEPPAPGQTSSSQQSPPVVFVYEFSAGWCPSCRKLSPLLKQTAKKYKGFAQLVPVDVDRNQDLSRRFNVAQIPTVMVFDKNGRMLNRLIGYQQGEQIEVILDHYKKQALAANSATTQ